MPIIFEKPPTGTPNPFIDFQPGNRHHYPNGVSGVYIWGLKIPIDKVKKFVPIYVGIAKDLGARLWTHYCNNRSGGNGNWYVFDYAAVAILAHVRGLYTSIQISDTSPRKGIHRLALHPPNDLIWYNDKEFFDTKLSVALPPLSEYYPHSGVLSSILPNGDLDQMILKNPVLKVPCNDVKQRIINAKNLFNDDFYFLYHPMDLSKDPWIRKDKTEVVKGLARNIEGATKKKLATRGIHTGSDAKKHFDNTELNKIEIDLSSVDDVLVHPNNIV
jgi:hypothetical protein